MSQKTKTALFILVLVFFMPIGSLFASDSNCLAAFRNATLAIERGASASQTGDACGAADAIEEAINWLITAENECSNNPSRLNEIRTLKSQMLSVFPKYIEACGH